MGKANRGRDTGPEMALRAALHRRGLRYRVGRRVEPDVRTTVDIAFGPAKVAVFVDGCFWHGCPIHGTRPKANSSWWAQKLEGTTERDQRSTAALESRGWKVIRVWEHEDADEAASMIETAVRARRSR